ncbi:glucose repressible protein mak10 [Anaeramoeba ignava]|uniref:Glucose repressible protein mak10 n=1 Tax=Anaeramoeba ignava TaxID=1746090 RepID=A0A9Q0LTD1_ANAIG|nr:glucose repressible protein mak10 [Anaeramoeba ignava]
MTNEISNIDLFTEKIEWEEIFTVLNEAKEEMKMGELLSSKEFTISKTKYYREIGNVKSDSGLVRVPGELFTIEEAQGSFPLSNLTAPQVLSVMDKLFCCEMTWLNGENIAQTIFSSFYCYYIESVQNKPLKLFCQSVLKHCVVILRLISTTGVYVEDEDFTTNVFGFNLFDGPINQNLEKFEKEIIQESELRIESENEIANELDTLLDCMLGGITKNDFLEALLVRFKLRKLLLNIQETFEKEPNEDNLEILHKKITEEMEEIILKLTKTHEKLIEIFGEKDPPGFDTEIHRRRISPPTQIRTVKIFDFGSSISMLKKIMDETKWICEIFGYLDPMSKINWDSEAIPEIGYRERLFYYLINFSHKNPNIISRSRLKLLVTQEQSILQEIKMDEMIIEDMVEFGVLPKYAKHKEAHPTIMTISFVFTEMISAPCFEKTTYYKKLKKLFQLWGSTISKGNQLDPTLVSKSDSQAEDFGLHDTHIIKNFPFSCWMLDVSLNICIYYISLCFELDLYSLPESTSAFWYLHYLMGIKLKTMLAGNLYKITRNQKFPIQFEISSKKTKGRKAISQHKLYKEQERQKEPTHPGRARSRNYKIHVSSSSTATYMQGSSASYAWMRKG